MPTLRIERCGQYGIITDLHPFQLPPNAWSGGNNVRFEEDKAVKSKGYELYYDSAGTVANWDGGSSEQVYWAIPVSTGGAYYWIYAGLNDVRITDGSTDKEITNTGGDYTGDADLNWTGGIISGIPILNNGVDTPQMWNSLDYATPTELADLTGFTAGGASKCGALRVYKNYIIAMDVTKSGTRYESMVKWSDSAAIGAVPQSWDHTDATKDAGENDLAEGEGDVNVGAIIDGMALRDAFMLYKDDSIWRMNFTGGNEIFTFRQVVKTQGMLSRRCMAEFQGNHFIVSNSDVLVTDGNTVKSVIDNRMKHFLFDDMDGSYYKRTFVFANTAEAEMWICYVPSGAPNNLPNRALIWNWQHNSWAVKDLPDSTPHISKGVVDTSVADDSWQTGPDTNWDTDGGGRVAGADIPWNTLAFDPQKQSPLICSDRLYRGDATNQNDGTSFQAYVERTDIPIGEQDQVVRIKAIYPRMEGSAAVNVYVGAQLHPGASPSYGTPVSFTPGSDVKVDCRVTGTHAAVKFESSGNQSWELSGYDIEYEVVGRRS